jgi:hypothetical protein
MIGLTRSRPGSWAFDYQATAVGRGPEAARAIAGRDRDQGDLTWRAAWRVVRAGGGKWWRRSFEKKDARGNTSKLAHTAQRSDGSTQGPSRTAVRAQRDDGRGAL